jgi:hypothetical protein
MDDPAMRKAAREYAQEECATIGTEHLRNYVQQHFEAGWKARASAEDGVLTEVEEVIRKEVRINEMQAGIMRDPRRTGGWDGAGRVAATFDRAAQRMRAALSRIRKEG